MVYILRDMPVLVVVAAAVGAIALQNRGRRFGELYLPSSLGTRKKAKEGEQNLKKKKTKRNLPILYKISHLK